MTDSRSAPVRPDRRAELAAGLARVRSRIADACAAVGRDRGEVTMIAVTKTYPAGDVLALVELGVTDVGENRDQEAAPKAAEVAATGAAVRWHFVGRLQRNKVRRIAPSVALWQSVDRLSLGAEIARRAPGAAVLVQVNLSGEATKGGCQPAELPELLDGLRAGGLDVQGLMTVGPLDVAERARPAFRELRRLADEHGLPERSMGMSDDLEVAVEEGTTMVRVGSALFGPRPGATRVEH
jgi:PLP dependent protein